MPEPDPNEFDLLVEGFLNGELTDEQRQRLAARLENNPSAARVFDDALRTEALLRTAHTSRRAKPAPVSEITEAAARAFTPQIVTPSRFAPRAWVALAAMVALMFGAVWYYKQNFSSNDVAKKSDDKTPANVSQFTVASGKVWVDGGEARTLAENQWINVSPEGPARIKSGAGFDVELDSGTGALLRKNGATLLNGSATFNVKSGAEKFILDTAAGQVQSAGGEFTATLEAAPQNGSSKKPGALLTVSVLAGSAHVDSFGVSASLSKGQKRSFGLDKEVAADEKDERRPKPKRPLDPGMVGRILEHGGDLELSQDQVAKLEKIRLATMARKAAYDSDAELRQYHNMLSGAIFAGDEPAAQDMRDAIQKREQELGKDLPPCRNPQEVLSEEQRQRLHKILDSIGPPPPERLGPPHNPGEGPRPPLNGPRPPLPPPGPDHPPPPGPPAL